MNQDQEISTSERRIAAISIDTTAVRSTSALLTCTTKLRFKLLGGGHHD